MRLGWTSSEAPRDPARSHRIRVDARGRGRTETPVTGMPAEVRLRPNSAGGPTSARGGWPRTDPCAWRRARVARFADRTHRERPPAQSCGPYVVSSAGGHLASGSLRLPRAAGRDAARVTLCRDPVTSREFRAGRPGVLDTGTRTGISTPVPDGSLPPRGGAVSCRVGPVANRPTIGSCASRTSRPEPEACTAAAASATTHLRGR
jgi:hypothetical protein